MLALPLRIAVAGPPSENDHIFLICVVRVLIVCKEVGKVQKYDKKRRTIICLGVTWVVAGDVLSGCADQVFPSCFLDPSLIKCKTGQKDDVF